MRLWLTRLGDTRARQGATRLLAAGCALGFLVTMAVLHVTGRGGERWVFVLIVWGALVFLPLWLVLQAFQTLGPALRGHAAAALAAREDRYARPGSAAVVVEELFARTVVMPRIATPVQAARAREGAVALVARAARHHDLLGALHRATTRCILGVDAWVREVGRWAEAEAADSIQARWSQTRALAALAALTRTLLAVYEDAAADRLGAAGGRLGVRGFDGRSLAAFLDSALDYCDDLSLEVEIPRWEEPPLVLALPPGGADPEAVRAAWQAYADAPDPTPAALDGFLHTVLPERERSLPGLSVS